MITVSHCRTSALGGSAFAGSDRAACGIAADCLRVITSRSCCEARAWRNNSIPSAVPSAPMPWLASRARSDAVATIPVSPQNPQSITLTGEASACRRPSAAASRAAEAAA